MIGVVVLTALLASASLRLDGLAVSLLAAYVIAVAEVTALTAGLSPFRAVDRPTLALAECGLLAVAAGVWWLRGKPRLPVRPAAGALANALSSPVVAVLAAVVGVALVYELLLVLLAHPNNWDSLTYHLARAAAWTQHGGVYWIPNAPTDRMNEFQPVAEQQVMFLFVAAGRGALFALPQFAAQIAIMASIFVSARRLGYERRSAVCAALLFSTFTLVALEATTAQNDLVAASFPACAAAFLLSGGTAPALLAGVAVGLGLGVKLTTALVVPVLLALAIRLGRRSLALFACASTIAFVVLSLWGFVLNLAETGQWLGRGGGRVENEMSPTSDGDISFSTRPPPRPSH